MKPCYIIPLVADDGLSPNGKATDSDSVIFKVRILVAQLTSHHRNVMAFLHSAKPCRQNGGRADVVLAQKAALPPFCL